jgi:hypothetical protein
MKNHSFAILIGLILLWAGRSYADGMVSSWAFNEDAGIVAHDSVGSNNGTLNGPVWTSGVTGGALQFDGNNDYVNCGNDASLNITDNITISAWINGSGTGKIVMKARDGYTHGNYDLTKDRFVLYVDNLGYPNGYKALTFSSPNNVWTHIVATYDGDWMRVFVDGQQVASRQIGAHTIDTNSQNLGIGASLRPGYVGTSPFYGLIDEVRIYDRALPLDVLTAPTITYVVSPLDGTKVLPFDFLSEDLISDTITIMATPGEYEPASFVLYSRDDLNDLTLTVSDLTCTTGTISSSSIDLKVVKCWYQTGIDWDTGIFLEGTKDLVPELLLNNDALVKTEENENYLKIGEGYVWISDPNDESTSMAGEFADSQVLLPVNIPAQTNKQFWVTAKVPAGAADGVYTGSITISSGEETIDTVVLQLRVLPFTLASPKTYYDPTRKFTSSMYYNSKLHATYPNGTISGLWRDTEQITSELNNMLTHGITNPIVTQSWEDMELLEDFMDLRAAVGMDTQTIYSRILNISSFLDCNFYTGAGLPVPSEKLALLKIRVGEMIDFFESYGASALYFYGADEAKDEQVTAQLPAWTAIKEAGGKVFVSGYSRPMREILGNQEGSFELAGDIQDLFVSCNYPLAHTQPTKAEADKWHSENHRIWAYANPQAGSENPALYRKGFGFVPWKAEYDGVATWAYMHYFNPWQDFTAFGKGYNFVYPTLDGVINTIAWEGYREAIDDIRYGTTLQLLIEQEKGGSKNWLALKAEAYLENLDAIEKKPSVIRSEIIRYILLLCQDQPIIYGYVRYQSSVGPPVGGVMLSANNGAGAAITYSPSGWEYYLPVPYGWSGRVTPTRDGCSDFDPPYKDYTNVTAAYTPDQDYIVNDASVVISGRVKAASGYGINGVTLTFQPTVGDSTTVTTDTYGYYSKTLDCSWSGTVTVSKPGYYLSYSPVSRNYTTIGTNQSHQDYIVSIPLYGYVRESVGQTVVEGVLLSADNDGGSTETEPGSAYRFSLPYGWSGRITPSKAGCSVFSPAYRDYNSLFDGKPNQDYIISIVISGYVKTASGNGVDNVTLTFQPTVGDPTTVTTNDSGFYTNILNYNWSGTVTPSKSGYTFISASQSYSDITIDQADQNYTGEN